MNTENNINYEPLRSEVPEELLIQTDKLAKFRNYAVLHISIAGLAWVSLVAFGLFRSATSQNTEREYKVSLFIAWVLSMTVFGFMYLIYIWRRFHPYREGIKSDIRFKRFLEQNPNIKISTTLSRQSDQGSLLDKDGINLLPERSIVLFDRHPSQKQRLSLTHYIDSASIGSYRKDADKYCVISAEIEAKELPHVYFRPIWKQRKKGRYPIPVFFQNAQKVEISSEFDKYFETYVPENSERDVLYFLTPELMEKMIDFGSEFDIEIRNNMLFLYLRRHVEFSYDDLFYILESAKLFQREFSDNTQHFKSDVESMERLLRNSITGAVRQRGRNISRNSYVVVATLFLRIWHITAIGTLILFICILIAMAISTLL